MFARLNRYARYARAPIATLALWAVLVALLPAVADAEETPRTNARANAWANDQDTAVRTAHYVVVAPGDSLWSISKGRLGPNATGPQIAKGVERIYTLNRDLIGADPNVIFAGQRLALPRSLERHGAEGHGAGQVPRQAREAARVAHAGASAGASAARPEAERSDRGARSGPVRATDQAAGRSGEDFAGRTAKVPVGAHAHDAPEVGFLPEEAAALRVPAVRHPTARVTSSSPVSYLGDVRARVSSAISTLMDAVLTDDRYAGRQLLGWALFLISSGIGVFAIVAATWRTMVRHEREKDRRRRVEAAYVAPAAAAPVASSANLSVREATPAGKRSVQSKEPAVPVRGESKDGSSTEGLRRDAGRSRSRGGSALRPKPRKTKPRKTKSRRTNRRRKVVDEDPKATDRRRRGWQIGEGLRHSLEGLPLRPDALDDVLAELEPRVEDELRSAALVESRRTLSEREHRQASALRDLLALAQENRNTERPV